MSESGGEYELADQSVVWDGPPDDHPSVQRWYQPLEWKIKILQDENHQLRADTHRQGEKFKAMLDGSTREITRLKMLLASHAISMPDDSADIATLAPTDAMKEGQECDAVLGGNFAKNRFPAEIWAKILEPLYDNPWPIIDPGCAIDTTNTTEEERNSSRHNRVRAMFRLFTVCKVFREQGMRHLFTRCQFILTQMGSFEYIAALPMEYRSLVRHVNIRVVGKYYDDVPGDSHIWRSNAEYYYALPRIVRMRSLQPGRTGRQSCCWWQVREFLKRINLAGIGGDDNKVFPNLRTMRMDLVHFGHGAIKRPGARFQHTVKKYCGKTLEALELTGAPPQPDGVPLGVS